MLATNLHVVRPWLFGGDAEKRDKLEKDLRRFYDGKASKNDTLYRVKLDGTDREKISDKEITYYKI